MTAVEMSELRKSGLTGLFYDKAYKAIERGEPLLPTIKKFKAEQEKKNKWKRGWI